MEDTSAAQVHAPRTVVAGIVVGWVLVALKCLAIPTLFERWHVSVHPGWVILPTLIFAGLVTFLVATHDWDHD